MRDLLSKLHNYGLMIKQQFPEITKLKIVASDDQVVDDLKKYAKNDIGLYLVEPEIPKEGTADYTKDVINMQFIILSKIPDKIPDLEILQRKDQLLNLTYDIDETLLADHGNYNDFSFQFSTTDPNFPDQDLRCELLSFLDASSIIKAPISNMKDYIGWTIIFKLKIEA